MSCFLRSPSQGILDAHLLMQMVYAGAPVGGGAGNSWQRAARVRI